MTNKENESDDIITVEAVKDFLLKNNGKVKQSDLINEFRVHLSAPSTKVRARQEFKEILQLITAAKTENGEKYIILIKQAQEHFPSSVINRKAQRPMPARINHMKSRFDFLHLAERRTSNTTSDDEDSVSQHSSITIQSDSGISDLSRASVASSQSSLSYRMQCTPSMDSINTMLVEEEVGDLEDDIGLNDGLDMLAEEKEWMLAACHGNLNGLSSLLKAHPKLIHKKDFIMTALHWAAKLGRPDMVKYVISEGGDINCKSGYTPLHLAAASGHNQVIVQLIELYGANIHQRDHSGKKPKDIVKDTVAADVQRKLGRSLILAADVVISHDTLTTLNKLHKGSISETELVSDLPESTRSHLKTMSVVTPRSMSFLKLAKKHEVRLKSENSAESPKLPTRRVSKPILRERPKTQVISVPQNAFHQMVQPKASFEI